MRQLVFLLEEASARELLKGLLPRLVPTDVHLQYLVFEGKQDLERHLVRRLRGWQAPDSVFVVLRDQDAGDCHRVKAHLQDLVAHSGRQRTLVRVACRELEAWIVGDVQALAEAFSRPELVNLAARRAFRAPDQLVRPVEELRSVLPGYQKVDGARRVGPLLDPKRSQSPSFRAFCAGVRRLVDAGPDPPTPEGGASKR